LESELNTNPLYLQSLNAVKVIRNLGSVVSNIKPFYNETEAGYIIYYD